MSNSLNTKTRTAQVGINADRFDDLDQTIDAGLNNEGFRSENSDAVISSNQTETGLASRSGNRLRSMVPKWVQGSGSAYNSDLDHQLVGRLRSASLILLFAYAMFLARRVFFGFSSTLPGEEITLAIHITATVLTAIIAWRMCARCQYTVRYARATELLLFGTGIGFFSVFTYYMHQNAAVDGIRASTEAAWVMLIFIYALFIPNAWQRAAVMIGCMVAIPIGIQLLLWATEEPYRQMLEHRPASDPGGILDYAMKLSIAGGAGIWGVYTISRLRRAAFQAKELGQYRLTRLLGAGGMGEVYLGEHHLLKRPCAIKVIRPENTANPQALERFEREVQATAKLTHWNTVEIFDYGRTDDGTFYYVMEYLPGQDMNQLVNEHGAMSPSRVIHLLSQVCDALSEAHRQRLIHRDIKPGNIFIANRGGIFDVVKILDFGLVKPLNPGSNEESEQDRALSGSPLYLSPEQAMGKPTDERSDIYSLGAVAYFALTGRPPFEYSSRMKAVMAQINEPPKPPSSIDNSIPKDLESIVLKCLAKSPSERFQNVEELHTALSHCQCEGTWSRQDATNWWLRCGCPQKRELDDSVLGAN